VAKSSAPRSLALEAALTGLAKCAAIATRAAVAIAARYRFGVGRTIDFRMLGIRYQVSGIRYQVSGIRY
jgi:hypothetical protein